MTLNRIPVIAALIIVCMLCACRQNPAPASKQVANKPHKKHWVKTNPESAVGFDEFFKQFESNAAVQLAHIQFPLRVIYKTDEVDSRKVDSVRVMQKSDWHFSNEHEKGLIISKININPNEMHVLFQVEDTGIHTVYFFKREAAGWQLKQIEDSSD